MLKKSSSYMTLIPKGSQWDPSKNKTFAHETHGARHYKNNSIFFFSSFTKIIITCHYKDRT